MQTKKINYNFNGKNKAIDTFKSEIAVVENNFKNGTNKNYHDYKTVLKCYMQNFINTMAEISKTEKNKSKVHEGNSSISTLLEDSKKRVR